MISTNLNTLLESIHNTKLTYNIKQDITLIAVSKYSNTADILQAYKANHIDFGENKVQDLAKKSQELSQYPIKWHFIGTLQENKINMLLRLKPVLLHSLHSLNLAMALQKRLQQQQITLDTLLQINISKEQSKSGFSAAYAKDSYIQILQSCPNINLKGIMTIGSNIDDEYIIEKDFEATKEIFDSLSTYGAHILSMGMSHDYKLAIKHGSNCLRIGSLIFKS